MEFVEQAAGIAEEVTLVGFTPERGGSRVAVCALQRWLGGGRGVVFRVHQRRRGKRRCLGGSGRVVSQRRLLGRVFAPGLRQLVVLLEGQLEQADVRGKEQVGICVVLFLQQGQRRGLLLLWGGLVMMLIMVMLLRGRWDQSGLVFRLLRGLFLGDTADVGHVVEMVVHVDGFSLEGRLLHATLMTLHGLLVLDTPGNVGNSLVVRKVRLVLVHG